MRCLQAFALTVPSAQSVLPGLLPLLTFRPLLTSQGWARLLLAGVSSGLRHAAGRCLLKSVSPSERELCKDRELFDQASCSKPGTW